MDTVIPQALLPAKPEETPNNRFITPLLTDMYQVTMCYAYWKSGRHEDYSVFDAFFRKNPFQGEFTIFGGLEDCLKFLQSYEITESQVEYVRKILPDANPEFFEYLRGLDCSQVKVYGVPEGTIVFPRVPVLRVEGPLGICQLLETTLLNLCNFASLMTTNACRFRLAAGRDKKLLEFGLRRAQGPDGGMTASKYAFMGGFDSTSNVQAGYLYDIQTSGTHAHSFVSAYTSFDDIVDRKLEGVDLVEEALRYRKELSYQNASDSELAAFVAYAKAFPNNFLALVDTYETLSSGVPNFIAVALVLHKVGYSATGVRIDSGDLAYLSKEIRKMFHKADARYGTNIANSMIVASNDINEPVLHSLDDQGHEVDAFGIGTHLVTCQAQPALGMVYKLVETNGKARIKLSQDITKVTLPGAKEAFRLFGAEGVPLADLLLRAGEGRPRPEKRVLCRHPFDEKRRVYVTPKKVLPLLGLVWVGKNAHVTDIDVEDEKARLEAASQFFGDDNRSSSPTPLRDIRDGKGTHSLRASFPNLQQLRNYVEAQIDLMRSDHLRPLNPTPYKVSVSVELYQFIHELWMREVPIPELE